MRNILILVSACMAAGLILSIMPSSVMAAPGASLAASKIVSGSVEKAGYDQPDGYLPPPIPYAPEPPVVVEDLPLVPVRPLSCGEFHYWNGEACVDARYNDPDLGPK